MGTKTMSAWEARRNFGKLLNEVTRHNRPVVVESHGEPVAAVVPLRMWEFMDEERKAAFAEWRGIAERVNLSEEEANILIEQAIKEVRADRHGRGES